MTLHEDLINELQKEIEAVKNSLAYGSVSDYHSYREAVGTIQGLEISIGIVKDITKRYIEED